LKFISSHNSSIGTVSRWGAQLAEALRYKPEGHEFDPRWGH